MISKLPRGLRATKKFNFLDEDLNLQWLIASTKCTLEWFNIIKEQRHRMLEKWQKEIDAIWDELSRWKEHEKLYRTRK